MDMLSGMDGPEEMLWTTALEWDPTGCSLKLLCHLHEVPRATSTLEEAMLMLVFENGQHHASQYCAHEYSECPMSAQELRHILHQI